MDEQWSERRDGPRVTTKNIEVGLRHRWESSRHVETIKGEYFARGGEGEKRTKLEIRPVRNTPRDRCVRVRGYARDGSVHRAHANRHKDEHASDKVENEEGKIERTKGWQERRSELKLEVLEDPSFVEARAIVN